MARQIRKLSWMLEWMDDRQETIEYGLEGAERAWLESGQ